MGTEVIKNNATQKVALSWLILVAIQPVAVRYQRTTLNGTLIDIHPCAAVRRLNQVARILAPLVRSASSSASVDASIR